jgi:hypothetical protein
MIQGTLDDAGKRHESDVAERRRNTRYTTTMRVGTMTTETGSQLCLVKNVSAGGLRAQVFSPVPVDTYAHIAFKTGQRAAGTIIWVKDDHIGLKCARPIDVEELLTSSSALPAGHSVRLPRIDIRRRATLRIGSLIVRGETLNISQGGCKLAFEREIELGEAVVSIVGLYPIRGVVRWRDENCAGIEFNELIPLSRLAAWSREPAPACSPVSERR